MRITPCELARAAVLLAGCDRDGAEKDAATRAASAADSSVLAEDRLLANRNTTRAGLLRGDTLTVALEVRASGWYPGEDTGWHETVLAFAQVGKAGRVPGPQLRAASFVHRYIIRD